MKKYIKPRIIAGVAAFAVTVCFAASCAAFSLRCEEVRSDVLRLHILANSDSESDQAVKLLVRDALLSAGSALFDGSTTVSDARSLLYSEREDLISVAEAVLTENGFDYSADIFVADEYFETRTYGDVTMPAGRYTALKVILGEGAGHNWWCVMFPPLCLPAAFGEEDAMSYFDNGEARLVESSPRYEVRFKLVELIEKIKEKCQDGV